MSEFDRKLKHMAKAEQHDVPQDLRLRVDRALDALPEKKASGSHRIPLYVRKIGAMAAALILAVLIILPNVSTVCADTMGKLPVLGGLIRVVTVRSWFMEDDNYQLLAEIPAIDSHAGDDVNREISSLTELLVEEFFSEVEISGENGHGSLNITYDTVLQTERWFTLRLSESRTSGGSAVTFHYYHIDRNSGKRVLLGDLFDKAGWEKVLEEELIRQMKAEEHADAGISYRYEADETGYEGLHLTAEHDFILTEDGNLILPFDEYEIAPGYMGTPAFNIGTEVFDAYLAPGYRELFH